MSTTPNLGLPYIDAGQAQKHVTHNEALRVLDTLVQLAVLDRDLTAPPASPAEGQRWIVKTGATGAWSSHDNRIAAWQDGAWQFSTPAAGWVAYVADEEILVAWDGSAWVAPGAGAGGGAREVLTANRTLYVRTDGSDGNDGSANDAAHAFLTPGAAYSAALKLDLNGFTVTLQLADGAYASGIAAASPPVGGNIVVSGNPTTPTSVAISMRASSTWRSTSWATCFSDRCTGPQPTSPTNSMTSSPYAAPRYRWSCGGYTRRRRSPRDTD